LINTNVVLAPAMQRSSIEEPRAADCDRRIGLGDLAELHTNVALARIRAQHRNGDRPLDNSEPPGGDVIFY
jgi:hypothetical protein